MLLIKRSVALLSASILLTAALTGVAVAAPQILAVASTSVPIQMQCDRFECVVELSAICLQEHRASPLAGTEYFAFKGQKFTFAALSNAGNKLGLPSNLKHKITAARGHNAVQISVPRKTFDDYGIKSLSISVPSNMALIPKATSGDTNPQSEFDIRMATGPFRQLATQLVDNDTTRRSAAEIVNLTLNKLNVTGRSSVKTRINVIAELKTSLQQMDFTAEAKNIAKRTVKQCDTETKVGYQSLRQCLGSSHDQLIGSLNTEYWNRIEGGS